MENFNEIFNCSNQENIITLQTYDSSSKSKEIANDVKLHMEPMFKQFKNELLTSIEPLFLRLTNEVQSLRQEVKELKNQKNYIKPLIMPAHPFKDMEPFLNFEKSLQDYDEKFASFQHELSVVAKLPSIMKNCWRRIFVDELAQTLCWQGTEVKKSVRNLSTTKAIRKAALSLHIGEDQFIKDSRTFFQFAKNRLKLKKNYKKSVAVGSNQLQAQV